MTCTAPSPAFHRTAALASALAAALLLGAGCSDKKEAPTAQQAPAPASAAPAPAAAPKAQEQQADLQDKLNTYIDCYNRADSSFHSAIKRYASWVKNMDAGPTGKEMVVYGLYSAEGTQACRKAVEQVKAQGGGTPALDAAAAAYVAALEPLEATIKEAHLYYERENYKDDHFAKGKSLHPVLAAQIKTFSAASSAFSDALDLANDQIMQAKLDAMEKAGGRDLAYLHLSVMVQSKHVMNTMMAEHGFDTGKVAPLLDALEKTIDEMNASKDAKPSMWSIYASACEDFSKTAKALLRRVRDKTPYSTGEESLLGTQGGWMVEGSPDKLVHTYNQMVERSNRLN